VDALVGQDCRGANWTGEASAAECGQRHASCEALGAAGNRYKGGGSLFDGRSCGERDDVPVRPGTCVFQWLGR
jgi:hypothetical protein